MLHPHARALRDLDHLVGGGDERLAGAAHVEREDPVVRRGHLAQLGQLVGGGEHPGRVDEPAGHTEGAAVEALLEQPLHLAHLVVARGPRLESHRRDSQGAVRRQRHRVQVDAVRVEIVQEPTERAPLPVDVAWLDRSRVGLKQIRRGGVDRSRCVTAVADDDRRYALTDEVLEEVPLVRQRQHEIRVRVDVDEPGATIRPVTSMMRSADAPSSDPMATMRPSLMARSAR
ncbi:MAG: hypothetical protein R2736_13115 [Solirubrobacterales bacterium]